jgi:hypothetical protein
MTFLAVFGFTIANASGKHDHFVEAVFFIVFKMFERKHAAYHQWLTELVSEV